MIKAVVFDCFGVLSQGSLSYLAGLASPEKRSDVYAVSHGADRGAISHDEYLSSMSELINVSPATIKDIFFQQHIRNEPLVAYVKSLRQTYKTALLSNIGHSVIDSLFTAEELADLFDVVVLSSEVGMVKPQREIYELTATRLGLLPEECVMIDDIARNSEGAKIAGMQGIVFSSNEQLEAALSDILGEA